MLVRISEKKFVGPSVRLSDRPSVELEFSGKSLTKDKQVHGTLPLGDWGTIHRWVREQIAKTQLLSEHFQFQASKAAKTLVQK